MGIQVLRHPDDDLFAIFSTETDTFVAWEASREEVVEWFVERGAQRARRDAERVINFVAEGNPRMAYAQFALTWERAVEMDREHGGKFTADQASLNHLRLPPVTLCRGCLHFDPDFDAVLVHRSKGKWRVSVADPDGNTVDSEYTPDQMRTVIELVTQWDSKSSGEGQS